MAISFSYRELIATGLSGALLAFLASKWHVSVVLLGALSPMASVVIMAMVKAYSSGGAVDGPRLPGLLYGLAAFWWVASRPAGVRNEILLVGLRAGAAATVISVFTVLGTQAVAGETLSCFTWGECPGETPEGMPGPGSSASPSALPSAP